MYWNIGFLLKGKSLLDYTNLFSPNEYDKKDNNTKIFSINSKKGWNKKNIVLSVISIENLKYRNKFCNCWNENV